MTNVEALKNLFVAYGGDPADVANMTQSAEVINAIAGVVAESNQAETETPAG